MYHLYLLFQLPTAAGRLSGHGCHARDGGCHGDAGSAAAHHATAHRSGRHLWYVTHPSSPQRTHVDVRTVCCCIDMSLFVSVMRIS